MTEKQRYSMLQIPFGWYVVDYADELIGCRVVIDNPNATRSCCCGTSFSI